VTVSIIYATTKTKLFVCSLDEQFDLIQFVLDFLVHCLAQFSVFALKLLNSANFLTVTNFLIHLTVNLTTYNEHTLTRYTYLEDVLSCHRVQGLAMDQILSEHHWLKSKSTQADIEIMLTNLN